MANAAPSLNVLRQAVLGAVALASIGCVAAYVMRSRPPAAPDVGLVRPAGPPAAAPAAQVASNSFGEMIVEPQWRPRLPSPSRDPSPGPGLDAVSPTASTSIFAVQKIPLPSLEPVPSAPPAAPIRPENVPLPPTRGVPEIADIAPLPPPRPPEFGDPPGPAASDRAHQAGRRGPTALGDNLNFLQRLLGAGQLPHCVRAAGSAGVLGVASRPARRLRQPRRPRRLELPQRLSRTRRRRGLSALSIRRRTSKAGLRSVHRRLRHLGAHPLSAGWNWLEAHWGLGPAGRSPLRERTHARTHAAACL